MAEITGTTTHDLLTTTSGSDTITALSGDDVIRWTPEGRDTLDAGTTGESYDANPYNTGNPGGDRLFIEGATGAWVKLTTTTDGLVKVGGASLAFSGVDRLHLTDGNDTLRAGTATLEQDRGLTVFAGAGDDNLGGSLFADVLDGGSGNDTIWAGAGDDFVQSSTGHDLIYGGAGMENIRWGLGDDVAAGNDTIRGGTGDDLINIWSVDDEGRGAHVVWTSATNGWATSTMGDTTSRLNFGNFEQGWTHQGNDTVTGAAARIGDDGRGFRFGTRWGDDLLTGSAGDDTLEGGPGRDTIEGGAGDDLISANGASYDPRAEGDGDADVLIFRAGHGNDTVRGFDAGLDVLRFDADYSATETADGTLLTHGADSVLLDGVFGWG